MSMKGKKCDNGYATTLETDGVDYRWIADEMTKRGHVMSHSSARNHVLRAMKMFVSELYPEVIDKLEIDRRARNPFFQLAIAHVLRDRPRWNI